MTDDRLGYFDAMYTASADPYGLRDRWYEQRKRAVLLAALPHPRYRSAFEPGCGAGELSMELASRCDQVLAADFSDAALQSARDRARTVANLRFEAHVLPHSWPADASPFDLIVVSEVGYFLDAPAIDILAQRCAASLNADGVLAICNWRYDFDRRVISTDAVHAAFADIGLHRLVQHVEADFLLEIWCKEARSVAQRDGLL